jgi:hypothetical protein
MGLTPSPDLLVELELTLSNVLIGRYDDGDGQRTLVVAPYDPGSIAPYTHGELDYGHAAQLVSPDELDELIDAREAQRDWLRQA